MIAAANFPEFSSGLFLTKTTDEEHFRHAEEHYLLPIVIDSVKY